MSKQYNLICSICGVEYVAKSKNSSKCKSKECEKKYFALKRMEKKQEKYANGDCGEEGIDYIVCKEDDCGYKARELSNHIMHFHKMEVDEYKKKHGVSVLKCQAVIDNIKGENNVFSNHAGKFSPFSKNFIKGDIVTETARKAADNRSANGNTTTTLEYWLKQTDGNVAEAERLLKSRQSTFSKEKCIEKHGEESGVDIWKNRQIQWQENETVTRFSKISQELFWSVYKQYENKDDVYFATLHREERESVIYKYTSPSGKSYIGQTKDLNNRKKAHTSIYSKCNAFSNAVQKYGIENFLFEVLAENLTAEEADIIEKHYIDKYNTFAPNGYNLTSGGKNSLLYKESKKKMMGEIETSDNFYAQSKPPKNSEYILVLENNVIKPDFIDINKKKIIEFNGTYWHDKLQNPKRITDRDEQIIAAGYEIFHVKESDYISNERHQVSLCIQFLNS